MNTAGDDHRLRRVFGFVLVGDLTLTLGLVYATLQAMSAVDRVINDSDAARSQAQLLFVGTGLLGLAVTAVLITLGRRSSRRSLVALIGLGAALAASAVLLALLLPMPGPTRPVGSKPLALLALALGLLAWSTALITHRWRAADPTLPSAGARSVSRAGLPRPWRALAALVALLVAVGAGSGTWALRTTYRAAADEYLRAGRLTPRQPSTRSVLDGTIAWTAAGTLPENGRFDGLAADSFGLPVTVGSDVVSVDRTSGAERWRYFRSDLDDYSPDPITTADGRRVLVDWTSENAGYLVLDGESGKRISTLPNRYADDDLSAVLSDGVLVSHQQGRGSDSIVAVDFDGSERWRFAPGTCKDLIARATGSVAVVTVHDSCDEPRDQTVGLDLATGRQLWAITDPPRTVATTADVVLVSDAGRDDATTISAIDPRTGETTWTQPLDPAAGTSCSDRYVAIVGSTVQAVCSGDEGQDATLLRLTVGRAGVQRLSLGTDRFEDVALTADGRSVLLARERASDLSPRRLVVSTGQGLRRVELTASEQPDRLRLGVAGDQLFLGEGGSRILALH